MFDKLRKKSQAVAGAQDPRSTAIPIGPQRNNTAFLYDRLDASQIRLIQLEPGALGAPLYCDLQAVPLGRATGTYLAISYTWGGVEPSVPIQCNGGIFKVTENLNDALHRIRDRVRARLVWADAVCINQQDNDEKACQVPMMGQIFQKAKQVVIWLAPNSVMASEASQAIQKVASTICSCNKQSPPTVLRRSDNLETYVKAVGPSRLPPSSAKEWHAIDWVFCLSWFYRVWVIQEVASSRNTIVLCGKSTLDWIAVCLVAAWIEEHNGYIYAKVGHFSGFSGVYNTNLIYRKAPAETWLGLLDEGRYFEATDPRDKVFALLGLSAIKCGNREGTRGLVTDYRPSNTKALVYSDATYRHVEQSQTLDALCLVNHGFHLPINGFPTWVPRFDKSNDTWIISTDGNLTESSACAGKLVLLKPSTNPSVLRLSGVIVDMITSFTSKPSWDVLRIKNLVRLSTQPCGPRHNPMESMWMKNAPCERLYANERDLESAIAFAVTIGGLRRANVQQAVADFAAYLKPLVSEATKQLPRAQRQRYHAPLMRLRKLAKTGQAARFEARISQILHNHVIFCTRGGYFGVGPEAMQENDALCVMPGGKVPFVLRYRPEADTYALVGEAYVEDLMHGEALQGRCKLKDFTIR